MSNWKYLVYRVYTRDERPNIDERASFYGWSNNKSMIKAFTSQRSKKKYKVLKVDQDEIARRFSEEIDDEEAALDFVKIKSASTHEEIFFITTMNELKETEKRIQRMFIDQASLSGIDGKGNYLEMFMNLDDYYADALYYIGFRPPEVDILFPSADYHDDYSNITKIEELIDDAYEGKYQSPGEVRDNRIPGLVAIEDVANKIYYSVESFVKVLKDDL